MKFVSKCFATFLSLIATSVSWAGGGQTIEEWGAVHYQNYGKEEQRTLSAGDNYADYVRNYPDLLATYNGSVGSSYSGSMGENSQSLEQWGQSHYEEFGEIERRTLPIGGNYADYVRSYPDLLAAYNVTIVKDSASSSINYDESFSSCSYAKPILTCSGNRGGMLSCGLVGSSTVTCAIEGLHGDSFTNCSLVGQGITCSGARGGALNCGLQGTTVLCNYKSKR